MSRIMNFFVKKIRDYSNINLIKNSSLFDEKYYLMQNNKVKGNAAKHYYYRGYKEGKSPSYDFSNDDYLSDYPDILNSNFNPLVHYLRHGKDEKRKICKDNGVSFEQLYADKMNYFYKFNLYYYNSLCEAINIFVEYVNEDNCVMIKKIVDYCVKEKINIRIIHNNHDLNNLNKYLNIEDVRKKIYVEFLFVKSKNYVFVNPNDTFVCLSYKAVNALLNSKNIYSKIYYYINEKPNTFDDIYYFEKVVSDKNVICFSDKTDLYKFKTLNVTYKINDVSESNELIYKIQNNSIVGLDILNKLLLNKKIDFKESVLNVIGVNKKFHFDVDLRIYNVLYKDTLTKLQNSIKIYSKRNGQPILEFEFFEQEQSLKVVNISKKMINFTNDDLEMNSKKDIIYRTFENAFKDIGYGG